MPNLLTPAERQAKFDDIRSSWSGSTTRVVIVTEILSDCPTCTIDPFTDTSTDSQCPDCNGVGRYTTKQRENILAKVQWLDGGTDEISIGDRDYGDVSVVVATDLEYRIDKATYLTIDNKNCTVNKKVRLGSPNINRYKYICKDEGEVDE